MHPQSPAPRRQMLCSIASVAAAMTMLPRALFAPGLGVAPWTVGAPPAAEVPMTDDLVGLWSRSLSASASDWTPWIRLVVEFRPDGSYTSGICSPRGSGCVRDEATASIQGKYIVREETFTTDQGFVQLRRDGPYHDVDARKPYRWRVERVQPSNPTTPANSPPVRKLHVTVAEHEDLIFYEMTPPFRVRWVKRADR